MNLHTCILYFAPTREMGAGRGIEFSENHVTTNFSKKEEPRRRMGATKTSTRHIVRAHADERVRASRFARSNFALLVRSYRTLPSLNLIYQRAKQLPLLLLRIFFFFFSSFFDPTEFILYRICVRGLFCTSACTSEHTWDMPLE